MSCPPWHHAEGLFQLVKHNALLFYGWCRKQQLAGQIQIGCNRNNAWFAVDKSTYLAYHLQKDRGMVNTADYKRSANEGINLQQH